MAVCGNIEVNYAAIVKSAEKIQKKGKKGENKKIKTQPLLEKEKILSGTCGNIQ